MSVNLFAPLTQGKKDVFVEFKAGLMKKDEGSNMVRPDKRKGLVQLRQKEDLIHFMWKDRLTGHDEIDLMIIPGEAVFRKIPESKARCYVLEFKNGGKKLFFWMQDLKSDKDDKHCADMNKYMNSPPGRDEGPGGQMEMDNKQILQLLNGGLARSGGSGAGPISMSALEEMMRRNVPGGSSSPVPSQSAPSQSAPPTNNTANSTAAASASIAAAIAQAQAQHAQVQAEREAMVAGPSLTDVVDVEHLVNSGLFDNEEVVKKLTEFLPEGTPITAENMKDNVNSAQFKQAIGLFNAALKSGELVSVMSSFGLDAKNVGPLGSIEDFLTAIQKQAEKEKGEEKKGSETDNDNMDTEKS